MINLPQSKVKMNYCLRLFEKTFGPVQTDDRQKVMYMSQPCNLHRRAQKCDRECLSKMKKHWGLKCIMDVVSSVPQFCLSKVLSHLHEFMVIFVFIFLHVMVNYNGRLHFQSLHILKRKLVFNLTTQANVSS